MFLMLYVWEEHIPGGKEKQVDGSCRPTRGPHRNQASTEGDPFWRID